MKGYATHEKSSRESHGEWSHHSYWMQEMTTPILKNNQKLISQTLHGPSMLPSLFSTFCPHQAEPLFNFLQGGKLESYFRV